jgi:mono/diheme cytochrome c family protein
LLPSLLFVALLMGVKTPAHAQAPSPTYSPDQVTPPDVLPAASFGSSSFAENCAPCHGPTGQGDGPTAASLPSPPTQFADPNAIWSLSPAQLFHTTKFGRIERLMPPWQNQLNDSEIWQTVMYAWSLHTDESFVAQGQALYAESCAACHGDSGAGDGPDAEGDLPNFGDLTSAMVRSQADWLEGWQSAHPEIGEGWSEEAQRQVLEYIRTFTYVPAWESGYLPGPGAVRGTVTHGTAGELLPAGLQVRLDAYEQFTLIENFTTTVDADGNFAFTDLSVAPNISYLASTEMDGVRYSSPLVMPSSETPEAEASIVVYATSDEPGEIRIDRIDWIIDNQPGALMVVQLYFFGSGGDRTFTGAPVDGLDMPATVSIHVPVGAEQVTFDGGLVGGRYQKVGDFYYDISPLVPGEGTKQIVVRYLLPYDDTNIRFNQEFRYPVSQTTLLVAELPQLQANIVPSGADAWQAVESRDFQGRTYQIYRPAALAPTEIEIALNGLLDVTATDPREASGGSTAPVRAETFASWMAWSVGALGVLMIAGVTLWSWRSGRVRLSERPPDLRKEVDELARRIAQVDDRHALGQLSDERWQQQRSQLKVRMLELAQRLQGGQTG